jgi:hypothetical protein
MNLLASILNRVAATSMGQILIGSLLAPNKILCFRLLWMAKNDQRARQTFLNDRPWNRDVDFHHTQVMKKIIAKHGWPGEKLVGLLGVQAAWLLVQHADHDRQFQKQCHHLLADAVKNRDAAAQHLAYLTDRICVGDGIPQIYGTQFEYPIEDPEHVDERRSAVGLSSLAEYLAESRAIRKITQK